MNITVNTDGNNKEDAKGGNSAMLEFGKRIKGAVLDVIVSEKRPGGLLYA